MKDSTKKMKDTTDKMSRSTEQLKKRTEDLYKGTREIISTTNQNVSFDDVLKTEGISEKLLNASIFFASMEFQHWQGDYEDTRLVREELIAKAVKYFFWKIDDLIQDDYDIETPFIVGNIPWLGESYRNWINLSVLSVAMSKVHESQVEIAFKRSVPVYSMYEVIKESLSLKEKHRNGQKVPKYVEEVLRYEQTALYLLQLRHNFYPLILASKLSNIEDSFWQAAKHKYWKWKVNPANFNRAQYAMFEEILHLGFETRVFLKSINTQIKYNESVDKIYNNLTWIITDNKPFRSLIEQMGMNPSIDEVEKFKIKLNFQPKINNDEEKLVVLVNEYTGATIFVFNKVEANKAELEEKEKRKKQQEEFVEAMEASPAP